MRWYTLPLVSLALVLATPIAAQQAPNNMGAMLQQLRDNMQNSGVSPQDIVQSARQQMQDGTFNLQSFTQQLQDNGVINQDMLNNLQNLRQNYQQNRGGGMVRTSNLQIQLGATDDEWTILAPRIQKVVDLANDLAQGTVGSPDRLNIVVTQNQAATPAPPSSVAAALFDLNSLLADANASPDDIKTKLTALRDAKQKVQTDLSSARASLVNLVTLRQEGALITLALLE